MCISCAVQVCLDDISRLENVLITCMSKAVNNLHTMVFIAVHTLVCVVFADFACHSYQHNILEMFLYLVLNSSAASPI